MLIPIFEQLVQSLGCKMSARIRSAPLTLAFFDSETPLCAGDVVDVGT
jgi:hypothetical protein